MQDFEKLGTFYLGKTYDVKAGEPKDELLLYDSKDLTTHAVVVGMTGSGKTGLCLSLLEEAGMDRIPAIIIDPKGDIANLLLTFPDLKAEDFRPWVEESQATREGMSVDQFASSEAKKWRKGLEAWGQDGERIRQLRDTVDMQVFTPGSNAGRPLTVLKSFNAPPQQVLDDPDAFRERISAASSGLLALLGIDADPIRSREHILISKIFENAWTSGRDLDLARLIKEIQNPPFNRVGVMELDSFFSESDRMGLSMTLNNLLASPTFASWLSGEPLDIKRLLHTPEGKPCISIMSIAHLTDSERMFFVTILLNEILSWMRSQAGTSSLRAILYMDEVFGYFPPTKNPPSKGPMLTLLKQARAFGLGVVLATQNPVDLDYKGLSNTGTWFLGRLQTERDKMRVLEGLEGASAQTGSTFDRSEIEATLAGLGSRVFLMNNVHEDGPVVMTTRWAMSYLRGPLTRRQIQSLVHKNDSAPTSNGSEAAPASPSQVAPPIPMAGNINRPAAEPLAAAIPSVSDVTSTIPTDVNQAFLDLAIRVGKSERLVYRPALMGRGRMHFVKSTYKVDEWIEKTFLYQVRGEDIPAEVWDDAEEIPEKLELVDDPMEGATLAPVPETMEKAKSFTRWEKELKEFMYRGQNMTIFRCKELKLYSQTEETQGDFKVRLEQALSEKRDLETEKLRKKYASKFKTIEGRIARAQDKVEVQKAQYRQSKMNSMLSFGSSILGAVLGRKKVSATNVGRAATSMRTLGKTSREKGDVGRAEENLELLLEDKIQLEEDFQTAVEELAAKLDVESLDLEELEVTPRKSDISVEEFCVVWLPFRVDSSGIADPAY